MIVQDQTARRHSRWHYSLTDISNETQNQGKKGTGLRPNHESLDLEKCLETFSSNPTFSPKRPKIGAVVRLRAVALPPHIAPYFYRVIFTLLVVIPNFPHILISMIHTRSPRNDDQSPTVIGPPQGLMPKWDGIGARGNNDYSSPQSVARSRFVIPKDSVSWGPAAPLRSVDTFRYSNSSPTHGH